VLAAVPFLLVPSIAGAETADLVGERFAWFWASNQKATSCVDNPAQPVCGTASAGSGAYGNAGANPISPGHIGVAMKDGESDMRAYLQFDNAVIPPGADVSSFVVTLNLSLPAQDHATQHAEASVRTPATVNQTTATVQACLMREPWGDNVKTGGGGDPPTSYKVVPPASPGQPPQTIPEQNEPNSDCSVTVRGKPNVAGDAWVFDVTSMAKLWASGEVFNEGIAILPVQSTLRQTWTLEFHGPPYTVRTNGQDVTVVPEKLAASAHVEWSGGTPPPPPPPPPLSFSGGGGGISFPSFGNPIPTVIPEIPATSVLGDQFTAPGSAHPPVAAVPVASTSSTPAWVLGALPLGILGLAALANILGSDPIGLAVAQSARALGADTVTVVDPRPLRREMATALGASGAVKPGTRFARPDLVVDCTGAASAPGEAIAMPRRGGRVVIVGLPTEPGSVDWLPLVLGEIEVIGSVGHVYSEDYSVAIDLISSGRVDVAPMITDRIPLERAVVDGIERLAGGYDGIKILVHP
jgi:hypothetical protein